MWLFLACGSGEEEAQAPETPSSLTLSTDGSPSEVSSEASESNSAIADVANLEADDAGRGGLDEQIALTATSAEWALLVVPSAVWVVPHPDVSDGATTFKLSVRLVGTDAELIPPADQPVTWRIVDEDLEWIKIADVDGHEALVEIESDVPQVYHEVHIAASVLADDGTTVGSLAKVMIGPLTDSPTEDWIVVNDTLGAPPTVSLVNGILQSGATLECGRNVLVSLVRGAMVGNLIRGCDDSDAELSVFSVAKEMVLRPSVAWSVGNDDEEVAAPTLRALPVKVWVAVDPPEALTDLNDITDYQQKWADRAASDVALANNLLRVNRVGVNLVIVGEDPEPIPAPVFFTTSCSSDFFPDQVPGVLNVYYVDDTEGRAEYCARSDEVVARTWDVVHIDIGEYISTSLAHEIGHALALVSPGSMGHSTTLPGFRGDNVMWGHPDHHERAEMRSTFSIGQAYRMNADEFSWLNHSLAIDAADSTTVDEGTMARAPAETRVPCQCSDRYAAPCPQLALGLWSQDPFAETPTGPDDIRKCSDRVRLYNTGWAHAGKALLYGRQWRSEPGSCGWVSGVPIRENSGRIEFWFPNLVRDDGCEWRIAIFFDNHEFVFDTLEASSGFQSYNGLNYQNWNVGVGFLNDKVGGPGPLLGIAATLWWQGDLSDYKADIEVDTVMAKEIFAGEVTSAFSNRTGFEVAWSIGLVPTALTGGVVGLETLLDGVRAKIMNGFPDQCSTPAGSEGFVQQNAVNVYYVGRESGLPDDYYFFLDDDAGGWCTDGVGTYYILVNPEGVYSHTSVAHQLGHALSLEDIVDEDEGLDETNVMWAEPYDPFAGALDVRRSFSLGQVYRMNLDPGSWIVQTQQREGFDDACDPGPVSEEPPCPAIGVGATNLEQNDGGEDK